MSLEANILTQEQVKALQQYAEGMSAIDIGLKLLSKQLSIRGILWSDRAMHPAAESKFSDLETEVFGEAALVAGLCEALENNHGITIINRSVPNRNGAPQISSYPQFFMREETIETVLGVLYGFRKEGEKSMLQPQGILRLVRSRDAVLTLITEPQPVIVSA